MAEEDTMFYEAGNDETKAELLYDDDEEEPSPNPSPLSEQTRARQSHQLPFSQSSKTATSSQSNRLNSVKMQQLRLKELEAEIQRKDEENQNLKLATETLKLEHERDLLELQMEVDRYENESTQYQIRYHEIHEELNELRQSHGDHKKESTALKLARIDEEKDDNEGTKVIEMEKQISSLNALNQSLLTRQDELESTLKAELAAKEEAEYKQEILQNELNETKNMNEFLLDKQEQKKTEKTLKEDLVFIAEKMNKFNIKYDEQKLLQIYNKDINELFVEQEIDNTELSAKSMIKKLEDVKNYVLSVTKPDTSKYEEWDLNTTMIWINGLDNGVYKKYDKVLRKGFKSNGIRARDLIDLSRADLAGDPFKIQLFKDRKGLIEHFQSLKQQMQIAPQNDEGAITEYH